MRLGGAGRGRSRGRTALVAALGSLALAGTAYAAHVTVGSPEGHTTLDQILSPSEDPVVGYTTLAIEDVDDEYVLRDGALANENNPAIPIADEDRGAQRRSLVYVSQMTDFQLADEESPARVEFADGQASSAWRPMEAFGPQMIDASVRQLNEFKMASPVPQGSGPPNSMDFALITGDQADNQQRNETVWVRQLLEGNPLTPNSGLTDPADYSPQNLPSPTCQAFVGQEGGTTQAAQEGARYTGVQDYTDYPAPPGPDPAYYDPNTPTGDWATWPDYDGLMDRAQLGFTPEGLDVPFYLTNGNHDVLVQGNEDAIQAFEQIALGCTKALAVTGTPTGAASDLLLPATSVMLVPPDPQRQFVSKPQIKQIYGATNPSDDDHGFALVDPVENTASGGAASYYSWDPVETPGFRFISIDTNSEGGVVGEGPLPTPGSSSGNLDDPQFQWLAGELDQAEADGKLVVIFGHHPARSMRTIVPDEAAAQCTGDDAHGHDVNPGCDHDLRLSEPIHVGLPEDRPTGNTAETFTELLARHHNVVAYVAGHTHEHALIPFEKDGDDPDDPTDGGVWWEINTSAVIDHPTQSRLIELFDNRDGTFSIFGTVLDLAAPATAPASGSTSFTDAQLASIGRTFAFNDPDNNFSGEGLTEKDRNAEMLLGDPREADLELTKSDDPDPVEVGDEVDYEVEVTNNGPYVSTGVTITDQLPSGADFVDADPAVGTCDPPSGGEVVCDLGDLESGDSVTVTVTVSPNSPGTITNSASVEAIVFDRDATNDSDSEGTAVIGPDGGGPGGGPGGGGGGGHCKGQRASVSGTQGDDNNLRGTAADDVIAARGGDDKAKGRRGADLVCGQADDDILRGGPGEDVCRGGRGHDRAHPSCEITRSAKPLERRGP